MFVSRLPEVDEQKGYEDLLGRRVTPYVLPGICRPRCAPSKGLRSGIVGINPTGAAAPFVGMKQSGHEGIAEYLETRLGGFSA